MDEDLEEKLKCSILRILNLSGLRLFGCLIYNFKINIINSKFVSMPESQNVAQNAVNDKLQTQINAKLMQKLTANVSVQNGVPTINVYSTFIDQYTIPELTFVLIHEIIHFLNGDCIYTEGTNHEMLNLAQDHIINKNLKKDIADKIFDVEKISLPKEHFIIEELENKNLTTIEVYEWLQSKSKNLQKTEIIYDPNEKTETVGAGSGSGSSGKVEPEKDREPENGESENEEVNKKPSPIGKDKPPEEEPKDLEPEDLEPEEPEEEPEDLEDLEPEDLNEEIIDLEEEINPEEKIEAIPEPTEEQIEELAEVISSILVTGTINGQPISSISDVVQSSTLETKLVTEQIRSEARTAIENIIPTQRGSGTGSIYEMIKKMIEVKIPWDKLLDKAICSKILPNDDSKTWARLQKRPMALNLLMAGIEDEEKPCYLIIVCDTSGSINTSDLKKFSNIILHSAKYFDVVRIIKHDYVITADDIIESQNLTNEDIIFKFAGRGGTSHTQVFRKIEDMFENDDLEISLVVMLTDFYSDIEKNWYKFEWPKNIPVCICLTAHTNVPEYIDKSPIIIDKTI